MTFEQLSPMMAVPGPLPRDDDLSWAFEMKWDGVRALAWLDGGPVRLASRTGRDITVAYPELAALGSAGDGPLLLDGEVVAFEDGRPSFAQLQPRMHVTSAAAAARLASRIPVSYLIFDVLSAGGRSLLDVPYGQRRELLDRLDLGTGGGSWQVPPSFTGHPGAGILAVSRQHGLEGIVAKRLNSSYQPGRRSPDWRKIKNVLRQEFVVGGWRRGQGGRTGQIGSLLLGVHGPGGLAYVGHVGTGFTEQTLITLGGRLAALQQAASPFASDLPREHARGAVWVQPRLVVDVAFAVWTPEGRLRAASYQGLRNDKDPANVTRET
ncbi:MAG: non-homologous end-joining DNA ligase [Actinobacteria bacterium]|nr:non-homologous end-joining DNA ligase [Actinomycetota bacterium]